MALFWQGELAHRSTIRGVVGVVVGVVEGVVVGVAVAGMEAALEVRGTLAALYCSNFKWQALHILVL